MITDANTHFSYDPEEHITYCERTVKEKKYTGQAKCHPNDWEFESALVGKHYAYIRSLIAELCVERDKLRAGLKALNHLYGIFKYNNMDLNSEECRIVRRQIKIMERDLANIRDLIKGTKKELLDYIHTKDKFYKSIRDRRG